MINESLARRYATAIFSLASEAQKTGPVGDQLKAVAGALAANPALREFYESPVVQRSDKNETLAKAFDGKLDDLVMHLMMLLVQKHRETYLSAISGEYQKMLLQERKLEPLEVTAARSLSDGELQTLVDRISRKYQKQFQVTYKVDPSLGAGIKLRMGDRYIDGSLSGKIDELARALFTRN